MMHGTTSPAEAPHDFVGFCVDAIYPFGINLNTSSKSHTGTLKIGGVALLVIWLDQVMQVVDEAQSPRILGSDLILCG